MQSTTKLNKGNQRQIKFKKAFNYIYYSLIIHFYHDTKNSYSILVHKSLNSRFVRKKTH